MGKYSGEEVFGKINGRTGIIFFQNYWGLVTKVITLIYGLRDAIQLTPTLF